MAVESHLEFRHRLQRQPAAQRATATAEGQMRLPIGTARIDSDGPGRNRFCAAQCSIHILGKDSDARAIVAVGCHIERLGLGVKREDGMRGPNLAARNWPASSMAHIGIAAQADVVGAGELASHRVPEEQDPSR
jgi:hypothetical protein